MIELTWEQIKEVCQKKKIRIQYIDYNDRYEIFAKDLDITYKTVIFKNPTNIIGIDIDLETQRKIDFETNYKDNANRPLFLSPIEADTIFDSVCLEIPDMQQSAYYEWDFGQDIEFRRIRPRPFQAKFGDWVILQVWTKPGVLGPEPVKVREFGKCLLEGGDGWIGEWYEGIGTGKIPSYCTLRLVYTKGSDLTYRRFYADIEYII